MFVVEEAKNYSVKMSNTDIDESYHIFVKGGKEFIVGLWDVVYNDNDVEEDKIYDITELSTEDLKTLDVDSLVDQGYKIMF